MHFMLHVRSGTPLAVLEGHSDKVTALVWGPPVDAGAAPGSRETWLATGSLDRTAVLWAVADALGTAGTCAPGAAPGAAPVAAPGAAPGPPEIVAFHPDRISDIPDTDSDIVDRGADAASRLRGRARGVHRLVGHEGRVTALAFGPPGAGWVATSSTDKTAAVRGKVMSAYVRVNRSILGLLFSCAWAPTGAIDRSINRSIDRLSTSGLPTGY